MRHDLYYDLYIKEQDYWWHVGKRAIVYGLLRKFWRPNCPRDERRALDLGCGTGMNLDHMARYARPTGTDLSEEALRFCLERGHTSLTKADAAQLPFPGGMFDVITALDVIEHLDDDHVALCELRRVLKPGGVLIVSVPAYKLLWTYWDEILGHRRRYTTGSMRKAMEGAGLRVCKVSYSNLLILPPVVLVRFVKSLLHRIDRTRDEHAAPESDFVPVPRWVNKVLIGYYRWEARFLRRSSLPFGLSVICVAERPCEDSGE